MLYKRRCNATQGKGVEERKREERGVEGRKREWLGLGRSSRANRHGVLYPQIYPSPAPDSARSADSSNLAAVTPPILHFSFSPSHLAQIEIQTPNNPFSTQLSFSSSPFTFSLALSGRELARYLFLSYSLSDSSHCYLILSVPFSLSYPSSISPHEPYLHEAVPPRCFNHLYLFQFSARFFLIPSDQTGEAFILTPYPLICAAMRPAIPNMLCPITLVTPSELDPAKMSSSARLAGFPSPSRQSAKKNTTFTLFGGEWNIITK
jgi:hypothetical protein